MRSVDGEMNAVEGNFGMDSFPFKYLQWVLLRNRIEIGFECVQISSGLFTKSKRDRECERGVEVEANKMTLCKIDNIDAMRCEMFQLRRINPLLCLFRSLLLSVRANGDFDVNKSFDTNTNQRMKNKNELQTHIKCNWSELATQMRSVFSCCVCFFYSLVFFFVYYCLQKIKYKQFWRFSINFCTAYIQFIYENWEWWKWK